MHSWQKIDKHRLTVFTDAIMAIIMTLLVLDLKVPVIAVFSEKDLNRQIVQQFPHFMGFVISFSMIVIIWFSHHNLMQNLSHGTNTFAALNFLFSGAIATLPFSTALVSEYPDHSLPVAILAGNMLLMNIFLSGMYIYINVQKLIIPDLHPHWYKKIKLKMGMTGAIMLLLSVFIAFYSTKTALALIVAVPLMHCIPLQFLTNHK